MRLLGIVILLAATSGVALAFTARDARVELTVSGSRFLVGQPIPYELKITNLSKAPLPYTDCGRLWRFEPGHKLTVSDRSGTALPEVIWKRTFSIMCGAASLGAGEAVQLKNYVNQWVVLDKPGVYRLVASWLPAMLEKFAGQPPKSNTVAIEIVAATKEEKDALLAKARRQLADCMDPEQKADAVWTLAYTLDSRAIPDLVAAGQDDLVAQDAESALFRLPDQNAVRNELLKQLRDAGPTEPLAYALSHFKVPATKSLPPLKSWLEKGASEQRAAALRALFMIEERYKDASLRPLILEQLKDTDNRVRKNAVLALGDGRFGDTLDAVADVVKNDKDLGVREQATIVLGWHKSDKAIPALEGIAKEGNRQLAAAAIDALLRIGSPAAVSALEAFVKGSDRYLSDQSQRALDQMKKPK